MRMVLPHGTGRLLNELSSDMNALFGSMLSEDAPKGTTELVPLMDIEERPDSYELSLDLPGVKPEDIYVDLEDEHVNIYGVRHQVNEENADCNRRVERTYGAFRRVFRLPKAVEKDAIVARCEHGVLTVTLPKAVKSGSRRIAVEQAESAGTTDSSNVP